jgi:tetratricopeptide (TPR) repeat protein
MIGGKTGLLCVGLVLCFCGWALAQDQVKLVAMDEYTGLNSTRIVFEFNRVPVFEVEHSGQRVAATFYETRPEESLKPLPSGGDIVNTLLGEKQDGLVVSLLLRRPPESVETMTLDERRAHVVLHWPAQAQASRPALSMDPGGIFQAGQGGAVGGRFVKSSYSGDWQRFLTEYESPVAFEVPFHFTRMPFPLVLGRQRTRELQKGVREAAANEKWSLAVEKLKDTDKDLPHTLQALEAEFLLRAGRLKEVQEVFASIFPPDVDKGKMPKRLRLLEVYALLSQNRPYLAYCRLFSGQSRDKGGTRVGRYWRMAKIETALATGRAKQALDVIGGLKTNTFVKNDQDQLRQRIALRRVQALLALGRKDEAQGVLNKAGISLQDMLTAPQAMAAIAELFYASKQYGRARPVYSQLPAVLGSDEEKAMAMWRAGMCLWRDGYLELARILLQNIVDDYAHTAAKFRARLSLADMKVQETLPKVRMEQVFTYKTVAARAPERLVREEAGLKHIVALYQLEELDKAAEELTVFLAYFAAGPLQHEARALLVELIPNLVPTLFAKDEMVKGLALVAKHRDTLVKTDLGADFLWSMGDAFASLGLYRRASRVFLYLLARTDDETQQKRLYARLLHLWSKQGRWGDIVQYTEVYAQKYPNGRHSAEIMALAAKILLDNGQHEKALQWLLDTSRPFSRELDLLTVRALSE